MFHLMHNAITAVIFLSIVSAFVAMIRSNANKQRAAKDLLDGQTARNMRAGYSKDVARARAKRGYVD